MTAKQVRIFELAKEVGLTSKELITLFNERLGGVFEAKNQLSVVPDQIADLVRSVLQPAAKAAPAAAPAAKPKPAVKRAPAAKATAAPPAAPSEAVQTLKPVAPAAARKTPAKTVVAAAAPEAPVAEEPAVAKPTAKAPAARPVAVAPPVPAKPVRPAAAPPGKFDPASVPEMLKPVPRGQDSIVKPKPAPPSPPPQSANSASPGPATGIPGRPGVAPRPGQPGLPGQGYQPRPLTPPRPGVAAAPGTANRRPAGNGPFRPLTPPAGGPRPFAPGAPRPAGSALPDPTQAPAPSSGGRPGAHGRHFDDKLSKKDREKDQLLEKDRNRKKRTDIAPVAPPKQLETIEIPDLLTVQELATSMIVPAKDVITELIKVGTMATINQNIPADVAISVAKKFGFNAVVKEAGEEVTVEQEEDKPEMMTTRPPVVTVLGHVDHGKTSLLDKIRSASVASGEAGGITQRIGAYTVERDDRKITFIDTPGHEAFTAMRARGAKVTDVAILVVAADDGVMPQTREAIAHVKAAGVPIVVAINKMDKPDAQPDRVKQQLAELELQPVDWGGSIEMVPVSARTGDGIDALLATVLLEADIRDLKANKNRRATGVVIESALDRGRGAVATVLIQNGTLRVGDIVVVGGTFGKIRALVDDKGKQVKKAGPSVPVEIMGLQDVPSAGDTLNVVSDERVAREAADKRKTRRRDTRIAGSSNQKVSLETFMQMPTEGKKTLNIIVKADGQGSLEALRSRMESLSTGDVDIRVIHGGVGAITPNDVNLASASNAVLIGFNIRPDETAKRLAENEQVDLRFYQVIYEIEDDLKKAMLGMLEPTFREVTLGRAEVREIFKVSKVGAIAGCYVQSGKIVRNSKVRVLRDSAVIFDGELESLRRFKDDVKEVAENFECGIQVARFADLKAGDVIEAYASEMVAPEAVGV
ncbi:MAG: translation initiation factor IF-2 [Candidatus Eremiobacteraeota bacterium]|nr:translation initiation factor IF-2 [Candidatus Eremiobacteraeota bacterium]